MAAKKRLGRDLTEDEAMDCAAAITSKDCSLAHGGMTAEDRFEHWRSAWKALGLEPEQAATIAAMTIMLGSLSRQDLRRNTAMN